MFLLHVGHNKNEELNDWYMRYDRQIECKGIPSKIDSRL